MSFPRYPSYKNSVVEWLGEVPEHWEVKRLGTIFRQVDEEGEDQLPILCVSIHDGVSDKELSEEEMDRKVTRSEDRSKYKKVEPGDLVYNMMRAWQGGFGAVAVHGMVSPAYVVARPKIGITTEMIERQLRTPKAVEEMRRYSQGVTDFRLRLYWEEFKRISVVLPPADEQTAIAAFLDRETGKIDALIAEQRRLIELLQEKRQAVISHAVTKGLNPAAPMKDSGIEWLGEVPEHWDVKRLKQVSPQITVGIVVEPSKYYVDQGVPALRSLNIAQGIVKPENMVFISAEAHDLHRKSRLNAGDLVAVRSGQPGTTAVIPPELDDCNCIDLIIIRKPHHGSEQFLCWYLASDVAVMQFSTGSGGAIQQHYNVSTAMDLIVTVPDFDEQKTIVNFLLAETGKHDELTAEAQRAIELLQERRAALISAAVTGQIDVRGLAATEDL